MELTSATLIVFDRGTTPPPATEREADVRNPSRFDEIVGRVRTASPEELDRAVGAAAIAQRRWAAMGVSERGRLLRSAADAVDARIPELATILAREVGTILPAATGELTTAADMFRLMADHAEQELGAAEFTDDVGTVRILRRPYGVIGCIVPWNAPAVLAAQKAAPALAAGNAVIVKPSPFAPLTVTAMLAIAADSLPDGLLQVVNGGGETGSALIAHPGIAKISFTGGGPTAQAIMRSAADRLAAIHFELGGNDPAIVLDDVDAETAAAGIIGSAFRRSGQVCYAIKRVYLPTGRQDVADAIAERIAALAVGDALDAATTMGPVNNRLQFDKVGALRDRAVAAGRRVLTVGSRVDGRGWDAGYFLQPSLVLDAEQSDEIVAVEQFGPILPLVTYRDEEEALAMANDSIYGLGASVWSADPERALAVAERIESGVAFVNAHVQSPLAIRRMPFGGIKQSGMGWENSPAGLEEYLQFHSVDAHGLVRR